MDKKKDFLLSVVGLAILLVGAVIVSVMDGLLGEAGLAGGISQGSGKILRIHSGSALYIRRIRCMAGPLVPHGLAGDRQCVFLSGACRSIRETWRRFDIGSLGTALGLGKDKGVEIFSEEWGCLRSAPSAGLLRLPHFQ